MTDCDRISFGTADLQWAGLAVFTNTRNTDPVVAADTVYRVVKAVQNLAPRIIYKKIDSSLRGNLGSELDAMVSALDAPASFVSPALPQQGRTTFNDCHQINGVPVAETEIGCDPLSPVKESKLSILLAGQSQMSVGHVHLDYLEKGTELLFDRVQELLYQGCRHIVFDAQTTEHLNSIASLSHDRFKDILLVGSAGLAGSLARTMDKKPVVHAKENQPQVKKLLFVCGSASQILAEQAEMLALAKGWLQVVVDPDVLVAGKTSTERKALVAKLAMSWRRGSLIISIAPRIGIDPTQPPDRVIQGLADIVTSLLALALPDALFLSGGDTAETIMHRAGSSAVLLREETLPGLMLGEVVGGLLNGLTLITKPGAFGQPETLIKLLRFLI